MPRGDSAITEIAPFIPFAVSEVPSIGSTATSHCVVVLVVLFDAVLETSE